MYKFDVHAISIIIGYKKPRSICMMLISLYLLLLRVFLRESDDSLEERMKNSGSS